MIEELSDDYVNYLCTLFREPGLFLWCGPPGKGKTANALLTAEILLETKVISKVASNIVTSDERLRYIDNLYDLDEWATADEEGKLYIFDEAGELTGRRSLSNLNVKTQKMLRVCRKRNLRLIYITQDKDQFDRAYQSGTWLIATFEKPDLFIVKINNVRYGGSLTVRDLPNTSIPFDTRAEAPFSVELKKPPIPIKELTDQYDWAVLNKTEAKASYHREEWRRNLKKTLKFVFTNRDILKILEKEWGKEVRHMSQGDEDGVIERSEDNNDNNDNNNEEDENV